MEMTIEELVQGSKTKALYQLPFLGLPMSKLKFVRDDSIRTACTDGKTVWYSGRFYGGHDKLEVTFINLHEVFHVILKHHLNTPSHFCFETANKAQDFVINGMLKKLADKHPKLLKMPESALYDERFDGMSWYEVYAILMKEKPKDAPNPQADIGGCQVKGQAEGQADGDNQVKGQGEGQADGDDQSEGQGDGQGEPVEEQGDGQSQPSQGKGSQESQSSQESGDYQSANESEGEGGLGNWVRPTNEDGSDLSKADKDELEAELDIMIEQATNLARSKGGLEAELMGIIEDLKAPKVNWRNQLRRFFAPVVSSGYHFRGFNRSLRPMGIKLPTTAKNGVGEILLNIDTSGSIVGRVDEFMAEFQEIVKKVKPKKVTVQYFHHEVWRTEEMDMGKGFQMPDDIKSGGTCFEAPMEILKDKKRKKPRVIVWLTDLCASFPEDPKIPTLWVSTEDDQAPWGKTIQLDNRATH